MRPILLPLTSAELAVVLDALAAYRLDGAKRGDVGPDLERADRVIDRALHLQFIDTEISRQMLLSLGIGVARGRGQG